eukprot:Tamp_08592.p1 GENE.Tamp_08592~~Tamp_08592.p1  ORF type:complete len:727 (-),score=133.97 Tamp_08592:9-2189(-)
MAAAQAARFEKIARECVRKKDERGEQLVISLDGRKRDRALKDEELEGIAQFLPDAVKELAAASVRNNRLVQVEFHGECNECGDAGAVAVCAALQQLRAADIAAVRAIFLWKNNLCDRGAMAVAQLVQHSCVPGHEKLWVAEVHLSHNKITRVGAEALFLAAQSYPRASHCGQVPLWLRLEHNAIDLDKLGSKMPPHCRAENRGDRRGGVQRTVHASNCGVSQCCLAKVPALHLHLFENQDKLKVEEARNAPPTNSPQMPIVVPPSKGWGVKSPSQPAPLQSSIDDFPSLPGAAPSAAPLAGASSPLPSAPAQQQRQQQQQPSPTPSLEQPLPSQNVAAPPEVGMGAGLGGVVQWLQAVTLGTGRLSTTRQLEIQVDSVFQLDEDERSGGREGVGGGEKGSGSITRHELRRVLVNNEPFDPSTLWSLLPPAGVGGGRSLDSIGATGVGGAASAAAGMGADFLSSAADVFWGRDAWEEGVMSGESEDEGDVVLPGGVSAGVYAQRVLRLMKSLHAQVPLLLVREPSDVSVLDRDLVVEGQLQERLFSSRARLLQGLASVRMLIERARVQELREGVLTLQHRPDDSLRLSMRYVLGFPISQDLRAAFPLVPTVDAKGKQGSVSAGEGVSEARSRDDAKEGRAEGGLLPLNVEAVATISVNELGRASAIRLDSVKFNGQDTIPAPLKTVLGGIGLSFQDDAAVGKSEDGSSKGGVREAASQLLRGLADLL